MSFVVDYCGRKNSKQHYCNTYRNFDKNNNAASQNHVYFFGANESHLKYESREL